ncbi:MAG: hypothetical protein JWN85_3505 [Gammaproteobacteria bacterium]|nr:hypothetical protein [Gammaproteobacteria bacterium]
MTMTQPEFARFVQNESEGAALVEYVFPRNGEWRIHGKVNTIPDDGEHSEAPRGEVHDHGKVFTVVERRIGGWRLIERRTA